MDFISDSLANGRRSKCLTVADDFTHECVDIAVDYGISGQYVTRLVDRATIFRGYSAAVRTDNGPEFTCRAFIAWAQAHDVRQNLIQPGELMQNGYIESFNGQFQCASDCGHNCSACSLPRLGAPLRGSLLPALSPSSFYETWLCVSRRQDPAPVELPPVFPQPAFLQPRA